MDFEKNAHSVPLLLGHQENTDISYDAKLSSAESAEEIKRAKRNIQKSHRKIVSSPVHFIAWEQKQQEKLEKERLEKLQAEKIDRQQKEEYLEEQQQQQRKHHVRQTSIPKEVELNVIQKITKRIRSKSQSIDNRQAERYLPELREASVEKLDSLDKVFDVVDRGNSSRMNDQRAHLSPELSNYMAKILIDPSSPKDDSQLSTTTVLTETTVTINS